MTPHWRPCLPRNGWEVRWRGGDEERGRGGEEDGTVVGR